MEDYTLPDDRITASSKFNNRHDNAAYRGRLNHYTYWRPDDEDHAPWITIDLGGVYNVSGVIAQGTKNKRNGQVPNVMTVKYFSSGAGQLQDMGFNIEVNSRQIVSLKD